MLPPPQDRQGPGESGIPVVVGQETPGDVLARQRATEPGELHVGQMPNEPEQGQRGRLDRAPRHAFGIEPLALQLDREAVVAQLSAQRVPLVVETTLAPRILLRRHEHVRRTGAGGDGAQLTIVGRHATSVDHAARSLPAEEGLAAGVGSQWH